MLISSNQYLTVDEMKDNAQYILDKLVSKGWTVNAVCGMLGNMQTESTINPGIWESLNYGNMSGGFGLVQWTPATKFTEWADGNGYVWNDIDGQIERIVYEKNSGLQWGSTSSYPMTFEEFSQSTETPSYLAMAFITNYERPKVLDQPNRATQAEYWYNTLQHIPTPQPTKKKKMPLYFYLRRI
jgi:hypothetical protein